MAALPQVLCTATEVSTELQSLATLLYANKVAMVYRLAQLSLIGTLFIGCVHTLC